MNLIAHSHIQTDLSYEYGYGSRTCHAKYGTHIYKADVCGSKIHGYRNSEVPQMQCKPQFTFLQVLLHSTQTSSESELRLRWTSCAARLFIIIFMMYTRKSECIPTVTNFASILANYFYFLRKITAQRPSVLNFRGRLVKFCQKSSGQTVRKWLFRSWFTKSATQNFM